MLFSWAAWAQSPLGTVTGIVVDATGSAVPLAQLRLHDEQTGLDREAVSNDAGVYLFPNLAPGRYKLSASAKGFNNYETVPFRVDAYATARQDIRFAVASANTEVTVNSAADSQLQFDSPAITQRLSAKQLAELPTNLRSVFNNSGDSGLIFQMMPLTIPGVVQVGAGATWLTPGATANGMKLKVDGIDTNFGNFGTPDPVSQPSFESVEEFTANVLSNKAEFGGLGAVTTVTKSGQSRYHGGVFWFPRNSAFDARNAFATTRPFQNIHNFGGNVSGPLVRNKTFFFFNYDTTRGSRAYLFSPSVPTVDMRQGDFSALAAGSVRDPYTNQPYPNNRIPASQISPVALKAQQQFFPTPNFGAASLTAANYRAAFNGPETHNIYEVRLDQNWSARHASFGRFQHKKSDYEIPGVRSALPPQATGTSENIRRMNMVTVGDTLTITPTMFNEFRAGLVVLVSQSEGDIKGQTLLDQFGITGLPSRGTLNGLPNIAVAGFTPVTILLLNPVNDGHYQLSDNLTWVKGRHTVKAGAEYIDWFVNRYYPLQTGTFGNFNFSGRFTGNAYADFLTGLPNTVQRIDPWPTQYFRWKDFSWFAQDDWKVTPRLTLSLGLRYEYNQPLKTRDGNIYSFDPASGAIVVPNNDSRRAFSPYFPANIPVKTASEVGFPETLRRADRNNFAPRFGFSYQPGASAKTVIRGGGGVYYNHYSAAVGGALAAGPFAVSTTANNNIVNGQPLFTFASPFAAAGSPSALALTAIDAGLKNAYTMQYSVTVEQQLSQNLAARVSYIGSRGVNQVYQRNINQPAASTQVFNNNRRPYPLYNTITMTENGAYNSYNGLQAQLTKRFSRGLQFSTAYTLARQVSEVDDTGNGDLNTAIEDAYNRRRDRGDVYAVPRHLWQSQALYELPLGRHAVLKGWQLNALLNVSSGHFLNPQFAGADPAGIGATGGRPDLTGAISYPETLTNWYDRSAFAVPPAGRFGNAPRNSIVGPGYTIFNLGVAKTTRFEKFGTLQLSATFQNALNHLNYGQPNVTVNNANGGTITSSHIFPAAGSARTGLLGLRWFF